MDTSRARRKRWVGGFTLVELLVATTVSGLVLAGVLTTAVQIMRSGAQLASYSEMNGQIRRALEQFGGEARLASDLAWNSAGDVTLSVPNAEGVVSTVTYAWSADTQTFFRVPGASSAATAGRTVLVRELSAPAGGGTGVTFERLNRSGTGVSTNAATKLVRISFVLSRTGTGPQAATQRASAVFALRNKPAS
jgi:prepilin-type N-terminal cleavage/methylation domain-containing protein